MTTTAIIIMCLYVSLGIFATEWIFERYVAKVEVEHVLGVFVLWPLFLIGLVVIEIYFKVIGDA